MHAAKDDRFAVATGGGHLAELVTVTTQIRVRDHLVLLVMMPQNQQRIAERFAYRCDSRTQFICREAFVRGQRMEGF